MKSNCECECGRNEMKYNLHFFHMRAQKRNHMGFSQQAKEFS